MRIVALIARVLLGLVFLIFGLNDFFHWFRIAPAPPVGEQFLTILVSTHYIYPVKALETVSAILLLVNRYVPLAVAILAPILVNIVLFHLLMSPSALPAIAVFVLLWAILFWRNWRYFRSLTTVRTGDI